MFEKIYNLFDIVLGLDLPRAELTWLNMGARAIIIYIVGILIVRIGTERVQGKPTTFDIMLLLILGSVISRAINGDSPFFATIGASFVLIFTHYFFSIITFYSSNIGTLLKGRPIILVKNGKIQWYNMRRSFISENDLLSALRLKGRVITPDQVKLAVLERNGEISVIPFNIEKGRTYEKEDIIIYVRHQRL